MEALLRASEMAHSEGLRSQSPDDMSFNIQDNQTGLNLDLMSFSAYARVGKNAKALLDYDTLLRETQTVFTTIFQHFASSTISKDGGWVFQPIGATLEGLGPAIPCNESCQYYFPISSPDYVSNDFPPSNTSRTINATISTRVKILQMNIVATWLSVGILVELALTMVAIIAVQGRYFNNMVRGVDTIADVLVLIAGSPKLLRMVEEKGVKKMVAEKVFTKLGWFKGEDGRRRYGIEVVDPPAVKKE
jgi:hypothetical protein